MNVREFIRSGIGAVPYFETISLAIERMDERGSLLRISSARKHKNLWGTVHGGVIASLADAACSASIFPHLEDDEMIMTTGLQLHYFVTVKSGALLGKGRFIRRGRQLAYGEAEIFDESNQLIAKGSASFAIKKGNEHVRAIAGVPAEVKTSILLTH
ncbi:MAG: PaaI family thioesterase [Syntrophales bacterium]